MWQPVQRLLESIAWKIFPRADLRLALEPGCQLVLRNRGDFIILREIFIDQAYRPFLAETGPVRNWVDLGCNCGMFSIYLERLARIEKWPGPRAALLIDANTEAIEAAERAVQLSGMTDQCKLLCALVADRSDERQFFQGKTTHKSSIHPFGSRGRRTVRKVARLDEESAWLGAQIDLVKIDIEGAEGMLVQHWSAWLQRANHLLIEWHEPHVQARSLDHQLSSLGFDLILALAEDPAGAPLTRPIGTGLWRRRGMQLMPR